MAWQELRWPERESEHVKKYGAYNDLPPNWREATEAEVAKGNFLTWSPDYVEHRQMREGEGKPLLSATLFFMYDGNGWALSKDYWGEKMRWYRFFLCEHELVEIGQPYRCYHEMQCKKCGWKTAYDSSD